MKKRANFLVRLFRKVICSNKVIATIDFLRKVGLFSIAVLATFIVVGLYWFNCFISIFCEQDTIYWSD